MNILFSVGELEKELNANTKIVLQIAEKLVLRGNQCTITGVCSAFPQDEITQTGVHIRRLPPISCIVKSSEKFEQSVRQSTDRNFARKQFIKRHPLSSAFQFLRYTSFYRRNIEQPRYLKQIKHIVTKYSPDAIVCVCKPINSLETVINSDINLSKFIWQLDPWGLHRLDNLQNEEEEICKEAECFKKSKHIFTTPVLLHQYSQHKAYIPYIDKMTAVEFPNIKKYAPDNFKSAVEFDSEYINLLFSGIVADEYRSPRFLLKVLASLFDSGEKIRIYFMGTNSSKTLDEFASQYPDNVIIVGKVGLDTALATMEKADILVNISNIVDNQVPSKIFDYFSLGKPILNVQKISNCPAQPYFDKYPLQFTINENDIIDIEKLRQFLYSEKNSQLNFEHVAKIYSSATVETVASQITDVISANIP